MIAKNYTMQNAIVLPSRRDAKKIERVLWKFPPTHLCIAMKKLLKDLASEKKRFKLCKVLRSQLSLYIYI